MKRRLSLFVCGLLTATAILSASSVSALAAPKVEPWKTVQAEMTFGNSGVTDVTEGDVRYLAGFEAGDYTRVKDVDFGDGYAVLLAKLRASSASLMEVRLDAVDGEKIGSFKVNNTNGSFKEYTTKISGVTGKHEVYFVGKIGSIDFDSWIAVKAPGQTTPEPDPEPTPVVTTVDPYSTVELENADDIVRVEVKTEGNVTYVEGITNGTLVAVKNVEFDGSAAIGVTFRTTAPSIVEVRDGRLAGEKLTTLRFPNTTGQFETKYFSVPDLQGTHGLFFVGTFAKTDIDSFIVLKAPVKPNPNPEDPDPTPVDPDPVDPDPTPVDPDPVDPDPTPVDPTPVDPDPIVVDSNLTAEFSINSWGTGFTVNVKVVNDSDTAVDNWTLKIKKSDVQIDSAWCVKVATEGDYYVITPDDWNAAIRAHDGAFFGFQGSGAIGDTLDYVIE